MTPIVPAEPRLQGAWRAWVAFATALVMAGIGLPTPAFAAGGGVTLTVDYGNASYEGSTVVTPGTSYTARLQYSVPELTAGTSVTVAVPQGITVPSGALNVPAGNTVVESLEVDGDGNVVITFKDPLDESIDQGMISFDFLFDEPAAGTGYETMTWSLNGQDSVTELIVREPGDVLRPEISPSTQKFLGGTDLSAAVSLDSDGVVTVAPDATDIEIPYTIRINSSGERTAVTVSDAISEYLEYDQTSFQARLTTWDADGFNQDVSPMALPGIDFSGQEFTIDGIDVPENSYLEITYIAHIRSATIDDLEAVLQERADAVDEDSGGNFAFDLDNNAVIDGDIRTASVGIGGHVAAAPSPNLGSAFSKATDPTSETQIELDGDGALVSPVDITYTLTADLTQFGDFAGTKHELESNVVITDTLPAQTDWSGTGFLTSSDMVLTEASGVSAQDFVADAYIGHFQVSTDGKTLMINVGRDTSARYAFEAQARITSVDGLQVTHAPWWRPQLASIYEAGNTAAFAFSDTREPHMSTVHNALVVPQAPGSEIDDPSEFAKNVDTSIVLRPGQSAQVPYTFLVASGAVPDLRSSRIIDELDTTIFDASDLSIIQDSITGSYDYQAGLTGADFDLSLEGDDLVFTPSAAFGQDLPAWVDLDGDLTGRLQFTATIPTHAIMGKQTLSITNTARVEGDDEEAYIWTSSAVGSATTYGNELEVEKMLYSGNGDWTKNLRVGLDSQGDLETDEFIYRVRLIPHGNYSGVAIIPLADTLPAGTEFLGFLTDAQVDSGNVTATDSIAMGANVTATWDSAADTVRIEQDAGTTLPQGASSVVNFKVRVTKFTDDQGIINAIGNAKATITPSNGYPLMILKEDSERPTVTITDRDARFTIAGPDGEVLTSGAYVVDGQLMVAGDDGGDRSVVVPADPERPGGVPAGRYTVTETTPPAGYALAESPVVATISAEGESEGVTIFNDPLPLFAIGDLVWIDTDEDGLQGPDEDVLAGTSVELLDADSGDVLRSTVTDANGRYVFDLLPAGEYRVRFTLTDDQAAEYTFTTANSGDDDAWDSDADRATGESALIVLGEDNAQLVSDRDYELAEVKALRGIDPTWDAGVVLRPGTVEVGDFVWIDENRDGRQTEGEPGIPGVVLVLTGPDGEPVTDVDGRLVGPTTTDKGGRYLFPSLPVLDEGQSYTVSIDREASAVALRPFEPTQESVGDRVGDSSLWSAQSVGLTEAGERDLTLDFGFVRVETSDEEGDTPSPDTDTDTDTDGDGGVLGDGDESPDAEGELPRTGADAARFALVSALLLLLGAAAMMWQRRRIN